MLDSSTMVVQQAKKTTSKYVLNDNPPIYLNPTGAVTTDHSRLHHPEDGTDQTMNSKSVASRERHYSSQDCLENPTRRGLKTSSSLCLLSPTAQTRNNVSIGHYVRAHGDDDSLCSASASSMDGGSVSRAGSLVSCDVSVLSAPAKAVPFVVDPDLELELNSSHMHSTTTHMPVRSTVSRSRTRTKTLGSMTLADIPMARGGSRKGLVNTLGDPVESTNKQVVSMKGASICLHQTHNPPPAKVAEFTVGAATNSSSYKTVISKGPKHTELRTIYQEVLPSVYSLPEQVHKGRHIVSRFLPSLDVVEYRGMAVRTVGVGVGVGVGHPTDDLASAPETTVGLSLETEDTSGTSGAGAPESKVLQPLDPDNAECGMRTVDTKLPI